jgi:hypothetical protein
MRLEHEYAARKLNGEGTEFMPVAEPRTFELVVDFKSTNQNGLTVPPNLLAPANRVSQ